MNLRMIAFLRLENRAGSVAIITPRSFGVLDDVVITSIPYCFLSQLFVPMIKAPS